MKFTRSDFKLYLILLAFYTLNIVIATFGVIYRKINNLQYQNHSIIDLFFELIFLNWVLFSIFILVILSTTKYLIDKNHKWYKILCIHLSFSILYSFLLWLAGTILLLFLNRIALTDITFTSFLRETISVLDENFTLYFAFVAIIYTYYFLNRSKVNIVEREQLKTELANSKIIALTSQLKPHFLFNTLNSIYTLIDSNKEKSKKMLLNLSGLLRELTEDNKEKLIPLKDELKFTNKYLEIVKERFSNDLKVTISVSEKAQNVLVPNLILQPIIENSIKHGYSKNHLTLHLKILIKKVDEQILIEITNNGQPLAHNLQHLTTKGIGIKNTLKRLNLLFKNEYNYLLFNKKGLVITRLVLPIISKPMTNQ